MHGVLARTNPTGVLAFLQDFIVDTFHVVGIFTRYGSWRIGNAQCKD